MPIIDHQKRKEYKKLQYERSKKKMYEYFNNTCCDCGKTNVKFEIHHLDKKAKEFCLTEWWARRWELILKELEKCVLLCVSCHHARHKKEIVEHGTDTMYRRRKCRCDVCKKGNSDRTKAWRSKNGRKKDKTSIAGSNPASSDA